MNQYQQQQALDRAEDKYLDPPEYDEEPIVCNKCGKEIEGKYTELFEDFYCPECIEILLNEGEKHT
jgi:predicted RNA-binding Zn-ribbon protein involved in translation (DUF1610 family)